MLVEIINWADCGLLMEEDGLVHGQVYEMTADRILSLVGRYSIMLRPRANTPGVRLFLDRPDRSFQQR